MRLGNPSSFFSSIVLSKVGVEETCFRLQGSEQTKPLGDDFAYLESVCGTARTPMSDPSDYKPEATNADSRRQSFVLSKNMVDRDCFEIRKGPHPPKFGQTSRIF